MTARDLARGQARSDVHRDQHAEVNDHMIAVNEQMGFRPVARLGEFQKKL